VGPEERQPSPALEERLRRVLPRLAGLGFYPVLALVERVAGGKERLGEASDPHKEHVRLRHDASLAFPHADVSQVRLETGEGAPPSGRLEITATFLGLTGAVTPLPAYLAEEASGDEPEAVTARSYLDVFHHRLLSLLYRGIAKYRPTYEATTGANDTWSWRFLALSALEPLGAEERAALPKSVLLRLTPLLGDGARPVRSLELALEEALAWALRGNNGPRVRVEQFVGAWAELPEGDRTALGVRNHVLGRRARLGKRVFARGGTLRIHVSALSAESYARLAGGKLDPLISAVVTMTQRAFPPLSPLLTI